MRKKKMITIYYEQAAKEIEKGKIIERERKENNRGFQKQKDTESNIKRKEKNSDKRDESSKVKRKEKDDYYLL